MEGLSVSRYPFFCHFVNASVYLYIYIYIFVSDINDTILLLNNLTIDIKPHSGGHYVPLHFDKYLEIRVSTSGGRLRLYNF